MMLKFTQRPVPATDIMMLFVKIPLKMSTILIFVLFENNTIRVSEVNQLTHMLSIISTDSGKIWPLNQFPNAI